VITPADSAPVAPPQMPAAPGAGPAPVPYGGADQAAGPPVVAPQPAPDVGYAAGAGVLNTVTGANMVTGSPLKAPNVNPYDAGAIDTVDFPGDADPGGRDDVAGTVSGAVANAEARFREHEGDTHAQGSVIGDVLDLPAETTTGSTGGAFYDPPRDYGDGG